jgi:pyruvate/2-oxoacid:ferredoxin oxidoreductase alpha subunit
MNREKQRNDSIFTALNTAAAAIVTGTTTAQRPLSILAAAFGLSTAINDAIFQSYLFTEAPGLVSNKVKELQDTYQQAVEKAETDKQNPVLINTPESAYNAIQNYYHICLPQSIEGTLLQTVADASAQNPKPAPNPPTPPKKSASLKNATPPAATLNMSPVLK